MRFYDGSVSAHGNDLENRVDMPGIRMRGGGGNAVHYNNNTQMLGSF